MDNVAEWSPETMISNCLPIIPCLRTVFTASGVWEGIGDPRNPFRSLTMHSQPASRASTAVTALARANAHVMQFRSPLLGDHEMALC